MLIKINLYQLFKEQRNRFTQFFFYWKLLKCIYIGTIHKFKKMYLYILLYIFKMFNEIPVMKSYTGNTLNFIKNFTVQGKIIKLQDNSYLLMHEIQAREVEIELS